MDSVTRRFYARDIDSIEQALMVMQYIQINFMSMPAQEMRKEFQKAKRYVQDHGYEPFWNMEFGVFELRDGGFLLEI
jgi:predicted component of type VI protein secretion system